MTDDVRNKRRRGALIRHGNGHATGNGHAMLLHDRIRGHTSPRVNERIDREARAHVDEYRGASSTEIGERLAELDAEWDIDRALMASFAVVGGYAFLRGLRDIGARRRAAPWMYLFGAQLGFLLLHVTAGWCPPTAMFRRLGVRTQREIATERHALEGLLEQRSGAKPERTGGGEA